MAKETLSPMQQELLNRADAIFTKVAEAASKAYDIASEQLPDIAYQFIAYNRVYLTSLFTLLTLIEIVLLSATIYFWYRSHYMDSLRKEGERFIDYTGYTLLLGGITFFYTAFVYLITLTELLKPLIMVWFAPKLFLITEIIKLVK